MYVCMCWVLSVTNLNGSGHTIPGERAFAGAPVSNKKFSQGPSVGRYIPWDVPVDCIQVSITAPRYLLWMSSCERETL